MNQQYTSIDKLSSDRIYYGLFIATIGFLYLIWIAFRASNDVYVYDTLAFRIPFPIIYLIFGIGIIYSNKIYKYYNSILFVLTISNLFSFFHLTAYYNFDPNHAFILLGNITLYHTLYRKKSFLLLSYIVSAIGLIYFFLQSNPQTLDVPMFIFVASILLIFGCIVIYAWLHIAEERKERTNVKHALFNTSPDAHLVYNFEKDLIVDANPRAIALFNMPNKRAFGLLQEFNLPLISFIRQQILVIKGEIEEKGFWQIEHITPINNQSSTFNITVTKQSNDEPNELLYIRLIDVSNKEITKRLTTMLLQGVNQMPDMMMLLDNKEQVFYANKKSKETLGMTNELLTQFPHVQKVEAKFYENKKKIQNELLLKGDAIYQTKYLTQTGQQIPVEVNYSLLKVDKQEYSCVIARNITNRLKITQIVRQSEELFRTVFESGPLGIVICDAEGNISQANKAFCEILGYSAEELKNKSLSTYSLEEDKGFIYNVLTSSGKYSIETTILSPAEIEARYKRKDGREIWLLFTGSIIQNEQSGNQYSVVMVDDITQRKNAEEERRIYQEKLENSVQQLTQFAYVVSHDLQEPLRMVSSYLQLLERRNKENLDQSSKEFIHYAVDGAQRMHILIEGLLKYSRVNTRGKEFKETDLNKILEETLRILNQKINDAGAKVQVDKLPTVNADATQMIQVFQNLIINSIKYRSDKPPLIKVVAKEMPTAWQLCVTDNGIGIEEEYHDQIFGVFKRLHTREEYEGTGIGLAICKRIVERHKGTIHVKSSLGEGSTFYFYLPK